MKKIIIKKKKIKSKHKLQIHKETDTYRINIEKYSIKILLATLSARDLHFQWGKKTLTK